MILLGLGSNLGGFCGSPRMMLEWAVGRLSCCGFKVLGCSRFVLSKPYGYVRQPDFVNGIVEVSTRMDADTVLGRLHEIERLGGRRRFCRWGARVLDIDLLDYHGLVVGDGGSSDMRPRQRVLRDCDHFRDLILPHSGLTDRDFVLRPLADYAPFWRHPVSGKRAEHLLHDMQLCGVAGGSVVRFLQ